MNTAASFSSPDSLTDDELDRLGDFLDGCKGGMAMTLEELDGFFSALITGPELVMPSEYNCEVFGGERGEVCEFRDLTEANEILDLLMRHWNAIASKLYNGKVHVPLIFEDGEGELRGNDWARGFMRGVAMRRDGWSELANDEEWDGCLLPMLALCHEHDEDPKLRTGPIPREKREEVIALMAAGMMNAYEYFRKNREGYLNLPGSESRRGNTKVRRNEPCPCGSGKKYKKCCGGATVN